MLQRIRDTAAALAAAVTGTATDATDAAGCRFGYAESAGDGSTWPTRKANQSRPLPVWRFEISTTEGVAAGVGTVTARDSRAAFRAFARMIRGARTVCGPDGPAVAVDGVESSGKVLPQVRALRGPDGVTCGHVRIVRADGRPTRRRIGGGR